MIGSATMKLGKKTHKMKLSTRALARLEAEQGGKPFNVILDELFLGKGGVTLVASVLAAGLNDGAGISQEEAFDLIDAGGGYPEFMPLISDAIGKAFPALKEANADAETGEDDPAEGKPKQPAKA